MAEFSLVLIQMMLPSQIFIIPQYQMLAKMGATNSIFALVFPGLVSAFGTFFLRQAYLGIPNEIAEAAYLDGCNKWQTFVKVMLPLTGPSMAALAIFTAVFAYADLMWPLICNTDLNMMTLSAGLSTLNGQYTTNFPVLMAGSLLAMIPMVILYLIFQKQFIQGIAMTGGSSSHSSNRRALYASTFSFNRTFPSLSPLVKTIAKGTPFSPNQLMNSKSIFCGSCRQSTSTKRHTNCSRKRQYRSIIRFSVSLCFCPACAYPYPGKSTKCHVWDVPFSLPCAGEELCSIGRPVVVRRTKRGGVVVTSKWLINSVLPGFWLVFANFGL